MSIKDEYKEILQYFSVSAIMNQATEDEKLSIRKKQNLNTRRKLYIASAVFIFVQIIFIISDLITGLYHEPYTYLNLTAEMLFLISSVAVIAMLGFIKDKSSEAIPVIQFIYYLAVELGVLIYFASDIVRLNDNVTNAFYNMVVLTIFATYSLKYLLILSAAIFSGTVALIIALPGDFIWANYQLLLILFVLFFACANYFRAANTRMFYFEATLENMTAQLKDLSTTDFLTKLYNRTALNEYVKHDFANAVGADKPVCLMMIDIDDFKAYNDYYSHMSGDNCLHKIGGALLSVGDEKFRPFRYGGEEFLIIGIDVTENELIAKAQCVVNAVRELAIEREDGLGNDGLVTISMGCALSKRIETSDFASLLARADKELYRAKRAGKNCFQYRGTQYKE